MSVSATKYKLTTVIILLLSIFAHSQVIILLDNVSQDVQTRDNGVFSIGQQYLNWVRVGEFSAASREWIGYQGFNLDFLPADVIITNVVLSFYVDNFTGNPALNNPYYIDHCDFSNGTNGPPDFGSTTENLDHALPGGNDFTSFNFTGTGWYHFDVTTQVAYAWSNQKAWSLDGSDRWFQVKYHCADLGAAGTNDNYFEIVSADDAVQAGFHPRLTFYYTDTNTVINTNDLMDYLPQHLSHLDPYTWDKVQRAVMIRYRNDPPFPAEAIQIVASNCTFINLQDTLSQSSREDFTVPYPNKIYRLAYKNSVKHYDGLDEVFTNVPEWFMHEAGGSPNIYILDGIYPYYNLRNTNTLYHGTNLHNWWIAQARDQISRTPPGNSLFIDSLVGALRTGQGVLAGGYDYWGNYIGESPYYNNTYTEDFLKPFLEKLRDEFKDEVMLTGNFLRPSFLTNGNYEYVRDYVHCSYMENFEVFGSNYTDYLHTGIELYKRVSEDGKVIHFNLHTEKPTPAPILTVEEKRVKASNAMRVFYLSLSNQVEKDALADLYAYFEFKLALFLLGANEYSYFGYQSTVIGDDAGDRIFRAVPPFPEFYYPLGTPFGPAVRNGDVWTRDFQYASVSLNAASGTADINWLPVSNTNTNTFPAETRSSKLRLVPSYLEEDDQVILLEGVPLDVSEVTIYNLNGDMISVMVKIENYTADDDSQDYQLFRWTAETSAENLPAGVYFIPIGGEILRLVAE